MPIVTWDGSLSIGHDMIDRHHEHLVQLLNDTYDQFCDHDSVLSLGPLLEELIDYATYHFAQEEELMTSTTYPEKEAHLAEHDRFVKRVTEIQKDFITGDVPITLETISFLKGWLVNHISKVDLKLAAYANGRR